MRIVVDRDRCIGAGQCLAAAPELFTQSEDGLVYLLRETVPESECEELRQAIELCPARVITMAPPDK